MAIRQIKSAKAAGPAKALKSDIEVTRTQNNFMQVNIKITIFNMNFITLLLYSDETLRTTTTIIRLIKVFINSRLHKILNIHRLDTISKSVLWGRTNQLLFEEENKKKRWK
ncbi:unnamed protein product [Schistosoma margrebowiei]|uniref:Uncharacterized protein n=1 Tax=Schistosoma margrebowiei TaxID=48269 RepID=A0A183M1P6_9TREM|nr:unnamed protein product [Schistosoma margrebowiei]